jgi:hypothetical protein
MCEVVSRCQGRQPVGSRGRVHSEGIGNVRELLLDIVAVVKVDGRVVGCPRKLMSVAPQKPPLREYLPCMNNLPSGSSQVSGYRFSG